jgi:hypothetical protein
MYKNLNLIKISCLIGALFLPFSSEANGNEQEKNTQASFTLIVKNNVLSANIDNAPLEQVLKKLAQQADIKTYLRKSVAKDEIHIKIDNLPLEEGIKRILKGKNYVLAYYPASLSKDNSASRKIKELRVVSGSGALDEVGDAEMSTSTEENSLAYSEEKSLEALTEEALHAPEPEDRANALKELARWSRAGKKEEVLSTAITALQEDKSAKVRKGALNLLINEIPGKTPLEPLATMAQKDPDPELRRTALVHVVSMSDPKTAMKYLEQSLNDPDPDVREEARAILGTVYSEEYDKEK